MYVFFMLEQFLLGLDLLKALLPMAYQLDGKLHLTSRQGSKTLLHLAPT
jgi:hypothetical protein